MKRFDLKAFLIDDEPLASERLAAMLADLGVTVVGTETNPAKAIPRLTERSEGLDALFLDIQMPGLNGFELLAQIVQPPLVVFTTAYDQYAIRAFEVNSVDYLLKPVESEPLARAVAKLQRIPEQARPAWMAEPLRLAELLRQANPIKRITSRVGDIVHLVDLENISHFVAKNKLICAVVQERQFPVDFSIQTLEEKPGSRFLRVHRSVLVNLDLILELNTRFADQITVTLRDQTRTKVTVSRDRQRAVRERLSQLF
ncbi:MAG: LytTR family transcriptional regulator DNA-binding domain-containing protein [Bryobacter sp.]|jgi:two-component system LytT family response regulator|nr:LytTR family transcriptional regulator DNA-binding domain-containing protein [Bryobacter sp. CoA8 C33]